MKRTYYKPVLRSTSTDHWQSAIPEDLRIGAGPMLDAISKLFNGENQVEHIWGKLLIEYNQPELISQVIETLDKRGWIEESPESGAALLTENERAIFASQMKALVALHQYKDVQSMTLWDQSGLPLQIALKKARLFIVHSKFSGPSLMRSLATLGIGNIISLPDDFMKEEDIVNLFDEVNGANKYLKFVCKRGLDNIETLIGSAQPDLIVYCPDVFSEEYCLRLNAVSLKENIPFLSYKQTGFSVQLGPFVLPRETACYNCYHLRLQSNAMPWEANGSDNAHALPSLRIPVGMDFLLLELIKFITGAGDPLTKGKVWQLNFLDGNSTFHPVYKLPRCPACGVHRLMPGKKLWEEL